MRNIRTVSCIIWRDSRPLLEELAHWHLEQKPRNAQMLAILASSLDTGPLAVHGLGEAVALAGEDDDVGVVDEPVNEGGSETVLTKDGTTSPTDLRARLKQEGYMKRAGNIPAL